MRSATASCADAAPTPRVVKSFVKCSGLEEPPQSIRTLLAYPGPLHCEKNLSPELVKFQKQKKDTIIEACALIFFTGKNTC